MATEEEDFETLMSEDPVGPNCGRKEFKAATGWEEAPEDMHAPRRRSVAPEARWEFLANGGWGAQVGVENGRSDLRSGFPRHASRRVLFPGEWTSAEELQPLLEDFLGVTLHEFDAAYRVRGKRFGPATSRGLACARTRQLVDPVLAGVVCDGGNVALFAYLLGIKTDRFYPPRMPVGAIEEAKAARQDGPSGAVSEKEPIPRTRGVLPVLHIGAAAPVSYGHARLPGQRFGSRAELLGALAEAA